MSSDEQPVKASSPIAKKLGALWSLREKKKKAKEVLEDLGREFVKLEEEVMDDMTELNLERADTKKASFTLSKKKYPRCNDKPRLRRYMLRTNPDLLTVNAQSLKSWFSNDASPAVQRSPEKYGLDIFEQHRIHIHSK